ncbi:MAG: hypothetical protein SPF70_03935 [Lachnospiraceae bacterium]|nr:hypothetical protein [Lachnospiraceae bacterium]
MSKYNSLWEYVQNNGKQSFKLTFEEIQNIAGIVFTAWEKLSFSVTE